MSGMMDKAKDMASKASGGSSGNTGSSGGSSDSNPVHKGIDMATDKAGLGDKYDSTINKAADSYQGKSGGK